MVTKTISIRNQTFVLHPTGSLFWEEEKMLLIADVHLGKVSHFRKSGVAVPAKSISKNFVKLASVMDFFKPETVVFLGDLFHSAMNNEWELFVDWFTHCDCKVVLIAGNHDVISPRRYEEIGIKVIKEWTIDSFLLTHHPTQRNGLYNFSGHIHPCVRLLGMGKQVLKMPCFFQRSDQMILPAFGEFTGTFELLPTAGDQVYAITKEAVILIEKH